MNIAKPLLLTLTTVALCACSEVPDNLPHGDRYSAPKWGPAYHLNYKKSQYDTSECDKVMWSKRDITIQSVRMYSSTLAELNDQVRKVAGDGHIACVHLQGDVTIDVYAYKNKGE